MDIVVLSLNKDFLLANADRFIDILADVEGEYWGREHFLTEIPGKFRYSCYAMANDQLAGYIIASLRPDGKTIHIHKFMVSAGMRGKKIGSGLLDYFYNLILADNKQKISLKVGRENRRAVKFYKKHGFIITSELPETPDGQNLILMTKKI